MTGDDKTSSPEAITKARTGHRSTVTPCPSVTSARQLRLFVTKTLNGQFKGHGSCWHQSGGEFPKRAFCNPWLVGFAGIAWSATVLVISRPWKISSKIRTDVSHQCVCSLNTYLIMHQQTVDFHPPKLAWLSVSLHTVHSEGIWIR